MKSILVAPGLGDTHWVMVKLQSFIEKELDGEKPEVFIWGHAGNTASRSVEFLKRLPFITYGGMHDGGFAKMAKAYQKGTPAIQQNYKAGTERNDRIFDWFLQFNGQLEAGVPLADIHPEYECNWQYPIQLQPEDYKLADGLVKSRHEYFLTGWFGHGHYRTMSLQDFPIGHIATTIITLRNATDRTEVLLTGAEWDKPLAEEIASHLPGEVINQAGRTSLPALLALIERCKGWIGFPAGNGILATRYRKPTVLLWDDFFSKPFWKCWAEPGVPYTALSTKSRPEDVVQAMKRLLK